VPFENDERDAMEKIPGMAGRRVGMVGAGRWLLEMAADSWDLGGGRD
jgi:hypothetical protein